MIGIFPMIDPAEDCRHRGLMDLISNRFRSTGLTLEGLADIPFPSTQRSRPVSLLARCPRAATTPLVSVPGIARAAGVAEVWLKDERNRMGLGSFKALGAAYVIARDATEGRAREASYVTASAGNHGLSVAAGAAAFGGRAVIFLSEQVPESFAARLAGLGAEVVRAGANYEESMRAAAAADTQGAILLSDSSWSGYTELPRILMEGYLVLMDEVFTQMETPPTHILLQAGVGGLAGAAAAAARDVWGDEPIIVVAEPEAAPALAASIVAGRPVVSSGPVSCMGRLDCKEPSLIALKGLARDADFFATLTEDEAVAGSMLCRAHGFASTPSGTAGVAALAASPDHRDAVGIGPSSRILAILSEQPEG